MNRRVRFGTAERRVRENIRDALASSLDVREVMRCAFPLLLRAVPAEYAAVAMPLPGRPDEFEWIAPGMPEAFFSGYAEMAPHDFVRRAVSKTQNVVLRDSEMVSRSELESNMMYHRARDLGMPLEHVMAVMLGPSAPAGIELFRSERRPFSEQDRALVQELTGPFAQAIRNCHVAAELRWHVDLVEALTGDCRGLLVLSTTGVELTRTAVATKLIESWFPSSERGPGGIPEPLLAELRAWASRSLEQAVPFVRTHAGRELRVRPCPIQKSGFTYWVLELEERAHAVEPPEDWRTLLTRREYEVAAKALLGWDNELIADELGCKRTTLMKHVQHVYDKLGVGSRAQLMALALRAAGGARGA